MFTALSFIHSFVNRFFSLLFLFFFFGGGGGGLLPQLLGVLHELTTVQATVLLTTSSWQPDAFDKAATTTTTSAKAPTAKSTTTSEWIRHFLAQVVKDAVHPVFHEVIIIVLNLVVFCLHAFALFIVSIIKIVFFYWFSIINIVLKCWLKPKRRNVFFYMLVLKDSRKNSNSNTNSKRKSC